MAAELTRASRGKLLGGVCAGVAARYGWSATTVRLVFLASCILPGPQFLVYLVLWLALPER